MSLTPDQVLSLVQQGLNREGEIQRIVELFKAVAPQWQELQRCGQMSDQHRHVLDLIRGRLQELVTREQQSVEALLARRQDLRTMTPQFAGTVSECGGYLETVPSHRLPGGAYLAEQELPGGDYLAITTTAEQAGAYLGETMRDTGAYLGVKSDAYAQVVASHTAVSSALVEMHVLTQHAIIAQHAAAAEVARHIRAAQVCNLHTQQVALVRGLAEVLAQAPAPAGYLAKEGAPEVPRSVSPEHAAAINDAIAQVEKHLSAHSRMIVEIQKALQSS
jgi:hypothetical protein